VTIYHTSSLCFISVYNVTSPLHIIYYCAAKLPVELHCSLAGDQVYALFLWASQVDGKVCDSLTRFDMLGIWRVENSGYSPGYLCTIDFSPQRLVSQLLARFGIGMIPNVFPSFSPHTLHRHTESALHTTIQLEKATVKSPTPHTSKEVLLEHSSSNMKIGRRTFLLMLFLSPMAMGSLRGHRSLVPEVINYVSIIDQLYPRREMPCIEASEQSKLPTSTHPCDMMTL